MLLLHFFFFSFLIYPYFFFKYTIHLETYLYMKLQQNTTIYHQNLQQWSENKNLYIKMYILTFTFKLRYIFEVLNKIILFQTRIGRFCLKVTNMGKRRWWCITSGDWRFVVWLCVGSRSTLGDDWWFVLSVLHVSKCWDTTSCRSELANPVKSVVARTDNTDWRILPTVTCLLAIVDSWNGLGLYSYSMNNHKLVDILLICINGSDLKCLYRCS